MISAPTSVTPLPAITSAEQQHSNTREQNRAAQNTSASDTTDPESQAALVELQQTDRKIRQHEQAHLSASGGLATSGASYSFTTGPDGKQYAVAGEVHIDVSPGQTPEETIRKARIVQAAALAPADPSGQDRAVAAAAAAMETQANAELAQRTREQSTVAQAYDHNELPHSSFSTQV